MRNAQPVTVGVLVTGALTAVLVAWFGAGWRAAERERDALEARAVAEAEDAADDAAAAVVSRLEELRASESQRPYFHYQNLFHDPRGASEGRSVVPSPLAGGPLDPLVALHFQVDGKGAVSTPTVNDEVPDNVGAVAGRDRALLAGLERVKGALVSPGDPTQIALATPAPPAKAKVVRPSNADTAKLAFADEQKPRPTPDKAASDAPQEEASAADSEDLVASLETDEVARPFDSSFSTKSFAKKSKKPSRPAPEPKQQVLALDPDVYAQNTMSNEIFVQAKQRRLPSQIQSLGNGSDDDGAASGRVAATATPQAERTPRVRVQAPAPSPVFITIAPLEWRAAELDGGRALVAVRQVTTPDGVLTQGVVVDAARIAGWLDERGGPPATLVTSPDAAAGASAAIPLAGIGWRVVVDTEAAMATARAAGAGLHRAFLGRFIPVAGLATLCAVLVVLLTVRAERLAQQRARFAAAAAHELRTPLAGIQLYGDMLVDGLGDPRRHRDYARRVAEEASRLGRVVANVLGFSQLERGSLAVRSEPGDLAAAVQAVVERAEPALTRAGAVVVLDAEAGLRARFDTDALARIVGNLLDNAEKYSREHADRSIEVTVRGVGDQAEIVVADHGPGLPASLRRRRFRPFARGTGDDGPPGLGLGLALSQNLATAMGGALTWRDRDHGAAFVVTVPRA